MHTTRILISMLKILNLFADRGKFLLQHLAFTKARALSHCPYLYAAGSTSGELSSHSSLAVVALLHIRVLAAVASISENIVTFRL